MVLALVSLDTPVYSASELVRTDVLWYAILHTAYSTKPIGTQIYIDGEKMFS